MEYSDTERKGLIRALELLAGGASSAFEYELWVAFGDGWTKLRAALAAEGAIRSASSGAWTISEAGVEKMKTLAEQGAQSGSTSGGEPGRDSPRGARAGRPRAAVEGSSVV